MSSGQNGGVHENLCGGTTEVLIHSLRETCRDATDSDLSAYTSDMAHTLCGPVRQMIADMTGSAGPAGEFHPESYAAIMERLAPRLSDELGLREEIIAVRLHESSVPNAAESRASDIVALHSDHAFSRVDSSVLLLAGLPTEDRSAAAYMSLNGRHTAAELGEVRSMRDNIERAQLHGVFADTMSLEAGDELLEQRNNASRELFGERIEFRLEQARERLEARGQDASAFDAALASEGPVTGGGLRALHQLQFPGMGQLSVAQVAFHDLRDTLPTGDADRLARVLSGEAAEHTRAEGEANGVELSEQRLQGIAERYFNQLEQVFVNRLIIDAQSGRAMRVTRG